MKINMNINCRVDVMLIIMAVPLIFLKFLGLTSAEWWIIFYPIVLFYSVIIPIGLVGILVRLMR